MPIIIITAVVIILTFVFIIIGNKVRDKFIFEKMTNENIIDVNDAVKFLRKNTKNEFESGVLYLTNKRLIFFKYRFNGLSIIPFLGDAFISIFIDKNALVEIPLHQLLYYTFKGKIIYHENRSSEQLGITIFYTKLKDEYEFDIYTLELINNKKPEILTTLDKVLASIDNPSSNNPNIN